VTAEQETQLREVMRRLRANEISENYAFSRAVALCSPSRQDAEQLSACEPFLRVADEIVNAKTSSPAYREWLASSGDAMVVFSFAGVSITLGDLRKAALASRPTGGA